MFGKLRRLARRLRRIRLRFSPVSTTKLDAALRQLIPEPVPVLFVHSSLSNCGHIPGGAATVVTALRKVATTVVLPTHTYCYPRPDGDVPVYDATATRSQVGAISDWFWRQPGVIRSIHPTHSLAAIGPLAGTLCEGHELCDTPCGKGTPYEKLIERDAAVLMLGCTMNTYTLFHTAEDFARCPYLYYPNQVSLRYRIGEEIRPIEMWRQDMTHVRRFTEMDAELEAAGLLRRTRLGLGTLLYIPSSAAVQRYLEEKLTRNPRHLLKD